mmetsp:Transcript_21365/g.62296  ORF Transcript_21365/g.62296 Transcript_21365/m.62296 type:complete len:205 (-) Transcript_21365:8-622(-)
MAEDLSRAIYDASRLMETGEYSQFAFIIRRSECSTGWKVKFGKDKVENIASLCSTLNFVQEKGYTRREKSIEDFCSSQLGRSALCFSKNHDSESRLNLDDEYECSKGRFLPRTSTSKCSQLIGSVFKYWPHVECCTLGLSSLNKIAQLRSCCDTWSFSHSASKDEGFGIEPLRYETRALGAICHRTAQSGGHALFCVGSFILAE